MELLRICSLLMWRPRLTVPLLILKRWKIWLKGIPGSWGGGGGREFGRCCRSYRTKGEGPKIRGRKFPSCVVAYCINWCCASHCSIPSQDKRSRAWSNTFKEKRVSCCVLRWAPYQRVGVMVCWLVTTSPVYVWCFSSVWLGEIGLSLAIRW